MLSFVLPVYNEEKNLTQVYTNLLPILQPILNRYTYEVLFVDDGSSDNSWHVIQDLIRQDSCIK